MGMQRSSIEEIISLASQIFDLQVYVSSLIMRHKKSYLINLKKNDKWDKNPKRLMKSTAEAVSNNIHSSKAEITQISLLPWKRNTAPLLMYLDA